MRDDVMIYSQWLFSIMMIASFVSIIKNKKVFSSCESLSISFRFYKYDKKINQYFETPNYLYFLVLLFSLDNHLRKI